MQKLTPAEIKELVRKERNHYASEWRKKNPERVKAANERYWKKRAERRHQERREQEAQKN